METQDNNGKSSKTPSKGTLFVVAALIGLLLGTVVTLLVIDITGYHHPTVVNMIPTEKADTPSSSDTVVKYIIHKYEPQDHNQIDSQDLDSIPTDSLAGIEETEDLTMDYDELYLAEEQEQHNEVVADKMLSKLNVKVVYLDANNQPVPTPEQKPATLQVQQWTTPIRNKMSYQFSGNILKLKGINPETIKIYGVKNKYLLQSGSRVYAIHPNTQFESLVESHDHVSLP